MNIQCFFTKRKKRLAFSGDLKRELFLAGENK